MEDVKALSATLLTEGFASLHQTIGKCEDLDEKKYLMRKADRYEEEILRRLGW